MYCAYISQLTNVQKHPNADRLQVATANGCSIITDMTAKDGDIGILFPDGGQVSGEFATANSLYTKNPITGEPMGGYLDKNARIKAIKLRGVKSEGLWLPLEALQKTGEDSKFKHLKVGDELTEWAGQTLCQKYYTPATRRAMAAAGVAGVKARRKALIEEVFPKHYDTTNINHCIGAIPAGDVFITTKLHGTSGRTAYTSVPIELSWAKRLWNKVTPKFMNFATEEPPKYISGTRNCILEFSDNSDAEKSKNFRREIHDVIANNNLLDEGSVLYYEIVGFEGRGGKSIMAPMKVGGLGDKETEKDLVKRFGKHMVYSYGCQQDGGQGVPPYRVFVYRLTEGLVDKPFWYIDLWCHEANSKQSDIVFEIVPILEIVSKYDASNESQDRLLALCDKLACEEESLATTDKHLREGVCVRVETPDFVSRAAKYKAFLFRALEHNMAEAEDYVDNEDIA